MSEIISYYTQGAYVSKCDITTPVGTYGLKDMIVEMSYFEDIYGFGVSGFLMIRDGIGLIDLLKLNGTEIITLQFDNYDLPESVLEPKKLIAYTIKDRRPVGNMNGEFYKIYFCSLDVFNNQTMTVSKSYKGKSIQYMVKDLLENELKTETPIIYIQPTIGYYNYIPPKNRPLKVVSDLSNFARPVNNSESGTVGADMFLFENRFGYYFASLNSMMNTDPVATFRYEKSNISTDNDETNEFDSVIALEYVRSYNSLREVSSGAYANKFIGVNYETGQMHTKEFNYLKYLGQIPPENGKGIMPPVNVNADGFVRVLPTNSGENTVDYLKNNNAVTPDQFMQETLSLRTSQLSMAGHTLLKIVVPGNALLTVGSTIELLVYKIEMTQGAGGREKDETYSGKYLITATRHIIQSAGLYQTVLEIAKNSDGVV